MNRDNEAEVNIGSWGRELGMRTLEATQSVKSGVEEADECIAPITGGGAVVSEQTIRIKCPNLTCQKILAVPISSRGKNVRCRSCGGTIRVPNQAKVVPTPEGKEEKAGKSAG